MKRFSLGFVSVLALAMSAAAQVDTWQIDPFHSAAQFAVRHNGISTVRGAFAKLSGTVQYDPADPAKTVIEATIDAASVDTRVEPRDNDLRSANFFDVVKFPTITFKSKHVAVAGKGRLKVTGDLTIHGVSKEVVLDVDGPNGPTKDPRGNQHMGASGTTQISRKDFGVSGAPGGVGDDVQITIDVEVVKKAPEPPK
ncbi:MAG TPA: YceI family protein [Verrucomicrobiae bacterium]|jgi:polyisoprenoid-binding protein YceI|nr:YceI family protein [Verrucomicrobiae bacterium]